MANYQNEYLKYKTKYLSLKSNKTKKINKTKKTMKGGGVN